jgi:hypothetical protein
MHALPGRGLPPRNGAGRVKELYHMHTAVKVEQQQPEMHCAIVGWGVNLPSGLPDRQAIPPGRV